MDKISRGSRIGEDFAQRQQTSKTKTDNFCGATSPRSPQPASPRLECASPRGRAAGHQVTRFATEAVSPRRETPNSKRFTEELQSLRDEFWQGLGKSPSAQRLSMSPEAKRSPRALARFRSEGNMLALAEEDHGVASDTHVLTSEMKSNFVHPGSPSSAAKRCQSPNFSCSADWMGFSSPRDKVRRELDDDKPRLGAAADPLAMPSSNFSSRLRRMHSGKITENSEVWLRSTTDQQDSVPSAPVIANSSTFIPSKGKRTGMESPRQVATAKERLRLDKTQLAGKHTQRKHDFPTSPRIHEEAADFQRISPRVDVVRLSQSHAQLFDRATDNGEWGKSLVDVQHRTSAGMISTLMPERTSDGIAACNRKIIVGDTLLDWSHGRRVVTVPAEQSASSGHHVPVQLAGMPSQGHRVHCYGTAAHQFTPALATSVGYSLRGSGTYNPHAPRVFIKQAFKQSL